MTKTIKFRFYSIELLSELYDELPVITVKFVVQDLQNKKFLFLNRPIFYLFSYKT